MECLGIIKKIYNILKKTTLHQTILMGKTTYMAIGRPLPHRKTIVVTRGELDDERVEVRHDLVETIQEYKNKKEELFRYGSSSFIIRLELF